MKSSGELLQTQKQIFGKEKKKQKFLDQLSD